MKKPGSKAKIKAYLVSNVGKVLTSGEIRDASGGVAEWARRLRELREDDGWDILSNNDRADLKPGQYLLESLPRERSDVKFARKLSAKLRAEVLDRNGFTCQMCGLTPGDIDPVTNRKVRMHIGHIKDKNLGGKDELANLRALCSSCNQGAKNVTSEKPGSIWLLSQVRRAGQDEQRAVYKWLKAKFPAD
jgi:5-methylcytosine-specific restriction endonuclease McrA